MNSPFDKALAGGLTLAILSIGGAFVWEGGNLLALFNGPAMLIIFGGTIGTALIGLPMTRFRGIPKVALVAWHEPVVSPEALIEEIVAACETARREGLLSLQGRVADMKHPFSQKYLRMFINGTDPEFIRETADLELNNSGVRHSAGAAIFNKMGSYSPTMGIIGTVMGLISTLAKAGGDPTELIHAIAVAFTATLWGVFFANAILLPIGDKLKNRHNDEELLNEITIQGVFAIQTGYTPRLVRTLLESTLRGEKIPRGAAAQAAAATNGANR